MAGSAVPLVIDALVAKAQAIPDVTASDGLNVDQNYGSYLMIGVEDPDSTDMQFSAETSEDFASTGAGAHSRDEEGDIVCAAWAWNGLHGSEGSKAARDAAYAILDALALAIREDISLGVPQLLWASPRTSTRLSQLQSSEGSGALLVFRINFHARL